LFLVTSYIIALQRFTRGLCFLFPVCPPPAVYRAEDTVQTGVGNIYILPPPAIVGFGLNGRSLTLGGGGIADGTYYVLTSTNPELPLNQWTVIATNAFDAVGNFNFTNAIRPNLPAQFFRLQAP
jgi:hypothetical protein